MPDVSNSISLQNSPLSHTSKQQFFVLTIAQALCFHGQIFFSCIAAMHIDPNQEMTMQRRKKPWPSAHLSPKPCPDSWLAHLKLHDVSSFVSAVPQTLVQFRTCYGNCCAIYESPDVIQWANSSDCRAVFCDAVCRKPSLLLPGDVSYKTIPLVIKEAEGSVEDDTQFGFTTSENALQIKSTVRVS